METRTTINTKKCPNCGKDIDVNAVYCVHCKSTIGRINSNSAINTNIKSISGNTVLLVFAIIMLIFGIFMFIFSMGYTAYDIDYVYELIEVYNSKNILMFLSIISFSASMLFFIFYRISRVENWVKFFINTKK